MSSWADDALQPPWARVALSTGGAVVEVSIGAVEEVRDEVVVGAGCGVCLGVRASFAPSVHEPTDDWREARARFDELLAVSA